MQVPSSAQEGAGRQGWAGRLRKGGREGGGPEGGRRGETQE